MKELGRANVELRRQIAERSRALSEALATLDSAPRGGSRLREGDVVDDRYRVVRALGSGGMGTVSEVERVSDGKRLALKALHEASNRAALARFAREAQIAAEIEHPNVVRIYDVGVASSGFLYVVMELATGGSLEDARRRFGDRAFALPILQQVADGLAALHGHGVIHRDLKPANVLLDDARHVRIADFGIAALRGDELGLAKTIDVAGATAVDAKLTRAGDLLGTPLYMAPELARGAERASAASDVFAFGVLAYEVVSGHMPFSDPPVLDALVGRTSAPPSPLSDSSIDLLIMGALSLDPGARPTLQEIASALRSK